MTGNDAAVHGWVTIASGLAGLLQLGNPLCSWGADWQEEHWGRDSGHGNCCRRSRRVGVPPEMWFSNARATLRNNCAPDALAPQQGLLQRAAVRHT